jgi:hypothetical protein
LVKSSKAAVTLLMLLLLLMMAVVAAAMAMVRPPLLLRNHRLNFLLRQWQQHNHLRHRWSHRMWRPHQNCRLGDQQDLQTVSKKQQEALQAKKRPLLPQVPPPLLCTPPPLLQLLHKLQIAMTVVTAVVMTAVARMWVPLVQGAVATAAAEAAAAAKAKAKAAAAASKPGKLKPSKEGGCRRVLTAFVNLKERRGGRGSKSG